MRFGVFASLLLHLAVAGLAVVGLPQARRDYSEPEAYIPLELIAEAELGLTTSVPAARPEPEPEEEEAPDLPEPVEEEPVEEEPPAPVEEAEPEPAPEPAPEPEPAPAPIEPEEEEAEPEPEPEPAPEPEPEPQQTAELDLDALSRLIDRERQTERAAPVETPSQTAETAERARPAVGAGDRLTASDEAKMKAAVSRCWNASAIIGAPNPETLIVSVDFELNRNGELASSPRVANAMQINLSGNRFWKVAEQTALRAVTTCAPYDFLPQDRYETWKDFRLNFDPSEMVGR